MDDKILANLVRVGTVSAVDVGAGKARVLFPDLAFPSGWLYVVHHQTLWMPKVSDRVLVLYIPIFNGDGFILGRI
jgi:phage baseplate assembly protein gpV